MSVSIFKTKGKRAWIKFKRQIQRFFLLVKKKKKKLGQFSYFTRDFYHSNKTRGEAWVWWNKNASNWMPQGLQQSGSRS